MQNILNRCRRYKSQLLIKMSMHNFNLWTCRTSPYSLEKYQIIHIIKYSNYFGRTNFTIQIIFFFKYYRFLDQVLFALDSKRTFYVLQIKIPCNVHNVPHDSIMLVYYWLRQDSRSRLLWTDTITKSSSTMQWSSNRYETFQK